MCMYTRTFNFNKDEKLVKHFEDFSFFLHNVQTHKITGSAGVMIKTGNNLR